MVSIPRITVYSKTFQRVGFIGDPVSVELTIRHNGQSAATVEVAADHERIGHLMTPGTRLVIDRNPGIYLSGPIVGRSGSGEPGGTVTLTVEDDWRLLSRVLGWPAPGQPITNQGAATAYDTKTGPAETVLKWFVSRNIARLGIPAAVSADLGRGQTITASLRMHRLADRLLPAIDQAGIGVTVRQAGAGLTVDCYTPTVRTREITPSSGIVRSWSWQQTGPTATRAIIGGQGEGTAREFRRRIATAVESDWADVVEVFVDARDTSITAELDARGDEALIEGAPKTGLKLELSETGSFRYGVAVSVGDQVITRLVPGGPAVTDILREVSLSWTKDDGLTITPVIGERTDDPNMIFGKAISAIARTVRTINARS